VFFCWIFFLVWFYPGDCDVRSVVGRRSFVCPLRCRFAPGDPPNAAQVLPARHPQSRWHFQGLPDRSRKQILLFFLFYFDRLNLFFFSSWPSDIDPAGRRLVAGQVLHGISDLQPVPGAAAAQEEPLKVGPFVLVQILRPGRPEQSWLPQSGTSIRRNFISTFYLIFFKLKLI
jgi:hypothetical protein